MPSLVGYRYQLPEFGRLQQYRCIAARANPIMQENNSYQDTDLSVEFPKKKGKRWSVANQRILISKLANVIGINEVHILHAR